MAEELALELEELRHLQSVVKCHHRYPQPPQPSFRTPSLFGKGAIIAATATTSFSINRRPPGQRNPTVRPQNAAKREGAKQERTNDKSNPNKHRNGFSASMTIAQYIQEYGALLNKGDHREDIKSQNLEMDESEFSKCHFCIRPGL